MPVVVKCQQGASWGKPPTTHVDLWVLRSGQVSGEDILKVDNPLIACVARCTFQHDGHDTRAVEPLLRDLVSVGAGAQRLILGVLRGGRDRVESHRGGEDGRVGGGERGRGGDEAAEVGLGAEPRREGVEGADVDALWEERDISYIL